MGGDFSVRLENNEQISYDSKARILILWYNSDALKTEDLDCGGPKAGESFISELQR